MGIVRPVMREYPYAWLFFVPFIIFATYTVMNLFIGILVSAISEIQGKKKNDESESQEGNASSVDMEILAELKAMRREIEDLKIQNTQLKAKFDDSKK